MFGDHGMVGVDKYLDTNSLVREGDVYFVDSVCLRFYGLGKEEVGRRVVDSGLEGDVEIVVPDVKDVGDVIVFAKRGGVFYPDFYNRFKVGGMHGYECKDEVGSGCVISNYGKSGKRMSIKRFYKHILEGLGL